MSLEHYSFTIRIGLNHPLIVASIKAFKLECEALSYVREKMGLKNVDLMVSDALRKFYLSFHFSIQHSANYILLLLQVPFCRTAEEGKAVIQILNENGLQQGKDGLQVWVMCELPSNVLAIDEFAKVFDGFSIGSNDLTHADYLSIGVWHFDSNGSFTWNRGNDADAQSC